MQNSCISSMLIGTAPKNEQKMSKKREEIRKTY